MGENDYSRRNFLEQHTLAGMRLALTGGSEICDGENDRITRIGDKTLAQLRDRYHAELFEHYLPNMNRLVVDREFGGFMCSMDILSWNRKSTDKRAWFEGRGIWVYSFLYNNLEKNPEYLEIARKSKDFILKHQPADDSFWIASYSREGLPLTGPGDIFGNLYIAEGLAEFAKASGEKQYFDLAKKILLNSLSRYDSPDYRYAAEKRIIGPRLLNHWMVLLRTSSRMLELEADPEIESLTDRCIDAVMNHHLNPEFNLLNEVLSHDFTRITDYGYDQLARVGIGIQTLWMILSESVRRKDLKLFKKAQELFMRHVNVARDPVYNGYFNSLDQVNDFTFQLGKVLSLHAEVLIGSLLLTEHTADQWAMTCFADTFAYVQDKFVNDKYAFPIENGNRKMSDCSTGMGLYHYTRNLMMNLLALNRIISRKGRVSELFA